MAESGQGGSKQLSIEEFERLFPQKPVVLLRIEDASTGARGIKWYAAWSARNLNPHDACLYDPRRIGTPVSGHTVGEALYRLAARQVEHTRKRLHQALGRHEEAKAEERALVEELAALQDYFEPECDNG